MKKIDLAILEHDKVFDARDAMRAVLRAFGIDPDAEYVEPAKPEAARWWKGVEVLPGHYHNEQGYVCEFIGLGRVYGRWHGPHATEEAAREHYEAGKRPVEPTWWDSGNDPAPAGWYVSERGCVTWISGTAQWERADRWHGPHAIRELAVKFYESTKPQPEAVYDARWVAKWWDSRGNGCVKNDDPVLVILAAEAARREREKVASNTITLQNKVEAARVQLATCGAVARGAFCPSEGSLGWSDSLGAVRDLRAELDELLWRNANQKRLLEQYQARLRERQPSADLAGIVERMQDLREKRVSDPDIWMLCNAVIDLAQAVAGMGGKP